LSAGRYRATLFSSAFTRGLRAGSTVTLTFVAIFIGVGIAAQAAGVEAWATMLMTVAVFAGPAQFAMIDVAAQTGVLLQVISVGVLVNLRFFVMSMTLSQMFGAVSRRRLALWAQFVSASSFLLTFFEARRVADGDMFAYFRGVVVASFPGALIGTALGVALASGLSETLMFGASLFLPVYFALLLVSEIARRSELAAVAVGLVGTPLMELWLPGWGLFIVALIAGMVATKVRR